MLLALLAIVGCVTACSDSAQETATPSAAQPLDATSDSITHTAEGEDGGSATEDGGAKDAGAADAGSDFCGQRRDRGTCDDNNPCTQDICDAGQRQCLNKPLDGGTCDDGQPCTQGDQCVAGKCAPGPSQCECQTDADCAKLDDGDGCNGTLRCALSGALKKCAVDPATVPQCPPTQGPCSLSKCDPAVGACVLVPLDGAACSDDDSCTTPDICGNGACSPGVDKCACHKDSDCAPPGGITVCSGTRYCDKAAKPFAQCAVMPGTAVTCTTPTEDAECAIVQCDPTFGACVKSPLPLQDGKPCSDGDPCTFQSVCTKGACTAGLAKDCADGNLCTIDTCDAKGDCAHLSTKATCDDDDACTTGESCQDKLCKADPAGAVQCDDFNPCTADKCVPKVGCTATALADQTLCEEGDPCSVGDGCVAGKCVAGKPKVCDDGDKCTAAGPCIAGKCGPGKPLSCDDANACTDDSCDKSTGCKHLPNKATCLPGQLCLAAGQCAKGACLSGKPRLFSTQLLANKRRIAHAVIEVGTQLWLGGEQLHAGDSDGLLVRLAAGGSVLGENVFGSKGSDKIQSLAALGNGAVIAGEQPGADGKADTWVARLDANGSLLWSAQVAVPGVDAAAAVRATPMHLHVAGWWPTNTNGSDGRALALDHKGKIAWQATLGGPGHDRLTSVQSDGEAMIVAGVDGAATGRDRGLVARVSSGKIAWSSSFGSAGKHTRVEAVAPLGAGWLVAGHDMDTQGAADAWVRLVDPTGGVTWRRALGINLGTVTAARRQQGGEIALVGSTGASLGASSSDAWMARLDRLGEPAGKIEVWSGPALQHFGALALLADGGLALAGSVEDIQAKTERAWLVRTDYWGHATCAAAGSCATKTAVSCGATACMTATCSKTLGCKATPQALPCDDGSLCTVADTCAKGSCAKGDPRLWQRVLVDSPADSAQAAARLPGGDFVVAGHLRSGIKTDAALWRLRPGGATRWKTTWGPAAGARFTDVLTGPDGVIAAVGHSLNTPGATAGWLVRVREDGKLQSLATFPQTKTHVRLRGVTQMSDGLFVAVGEAAPAEIPKHTSYGVVRWASAKGSALSTQVNLPIIAGSEDRLEAVVATSANELFAVGTAASAAKGPTDGWITRLSANAKVITNARIGGPLGDGLHAVARSSFGVVAAGDYQAKVGQQSGWLVALSDKGKLLFDRKIPADLGALRVLRAVREGFVAAGSRRFDAVSRQAWLVGVDNQLVPRMQRSLGQSTSALGLAALPSGDLLLAGVGPSVKLLAKTVPWAARVDQYGNLYCHPNCAAPLPKPPALAPCDDSNPCTIDICDGATGKCTLSAAADGVPCGALKACKAGKCG